MLNWLSLGLLLAVCAGAASAAGKDFDFDTLKVRARQQAAAAYSPPPQADGALAQIDPARRAAALLKARYAPWTMASRFVPLPLAPRAGCAPTLFNSIQASGIERFDYRPELFDWPAAGLPEPGPAATGFAAFACCICRRATANVRTWRASRAMPGSWSAPARCSVRPHSRSG